MRPTKFVALGLMLPALAFAGCGGSSDDDKITDIITEVGKEPAKLCDHMSKALTDQIGGKDACLKAANEAGEGDADPDVKINDITVDGSKATAKVTGKDGDQSIDFVKESDAWKVAAVN